MNDLAVKLKWNGGSRFTGVNAGGIETAIDADKQSGASPAELLLSVRRQRPLTWFRFWRKCERRPRSSK